MQFLKLQYCSESDLNSHLRLSRFPQFLHRQQQGLEIYPYKMICRVGHSEAEGTRAVTIALKFCYYLPLTAVKESQMVSVEFPQVVGFLKSVGIWLLDNP